MAADQKPGIEGRQAPRAPIELKVDYKKLNSFFADYTKNISQGRHLHQDEEAAAHRHALPLQADGAAARGRPSSCWARWCGPTPRATSPAWAFASSTSNDTQRADFEGVVEQLMSSQPGRRARRPAAQQDRQVVSSRLTASRCRGAALLGCPCHEAQGGRPDARAPQPPAATPADRRHRRGLRDARAAARRGCTLTDAFGGAHVVEVEVAATHDARTRGLMWRTLARRRARACSSSSPRSSRSTSGCSNTLIPLDMIFIDGNAADRRHRGERGAAHATRRAARDGRRSTCSRCPAAGRRRWG